MTQVETIHGSACLLGDRGVLIRGASGSGKSSLALHLIHGFRLAGGFACLVADDRLFPAGHSGRLICHRPPPIAGLVEIRPVGPVEAESTASAVIDLVVELLPQDRIGRLEEPQEVEICAVRLPRLNVAARNMLTSAMAICATLRRMQGHSRDFLPGYRPS